MAKITIERRRRLRTAVSEDVARIRGRYAEALAAGYSVEDAAKLASKGGDIKPPSADYMPTPVAPNVPEPEVTDPAATTRWNRNPDKVTQTQTVELQGRPLDNHHQQQKRVVLGEDLVPIGDEDVTENNVKLPDDVPENWQDLPWPQLRSLAKKYNSEINPASRKEAEEIISKVIAS